MDNYRTLQQILGICKAIYGNEESTRLNLEAISLYLSQDDVSLDKMIETFSGIMSARAANKDKIIRRFRSEGILPYEFYYANYPKNIAIILETCTRKIIAGMELTDNDYSKLKNIASGYDVQSPFYVELLEKIHKNGIYFKNEERPKGENNEF